MDAFSGNLRLVHHETVLILMLSVSGGIASADHIQSFILGFGVGSLAVGSCYWLAFRSTRFPQLVVFCSCAVSLLRLL